MRDRFEDLKRLADVKGIKDTLNDETRIKFEDKNLENFNAFFTVANKEISQMIMQNDLIVSEKDKMASVIGEKKQENTKDLIVRDAEMVLRKKLNDDEKENLLANPNEVIQTQMKSRLLDNAHTSLKNAVSDIEERYNDLVNLEKLFADLALLVAAQGEMINNIESNIHSAKEYVFQAEKNLIKSKDNLASARKKKCCILIIVIVIIIVIVAPILGTVLKSA